MGSQANTVQLLFSALQPVYMELPKLLNVAHNYTLIVELILELLSTSARIMLVFLTPVIFFVQKHPKQITVCFTCVD